MYLGTGLGMGFAAMACLVLAKGSREDASFATKLALFGAAARRPGVKREEKACIEGGTHVG